MAAHYMQVEQAWEQHDGPLLPILARCPGSPHHTIMIGPDPLTSNPFHMWSRGHTGNATATRHGMCHHTTSGHRYTCRGQAGAAGAVYAAHCFQALLAVCPGVGVNCLARAAASEAKCLQQWQQPTTHPCGGQTGGRTADNKDDTHTAQIQQRQPC